MVSIVKLFEELDHVLRPPPGTEDGLQSKTFKFGVENFLQSTRVSQLSWSQIFHERMVQSQSILVQEKYSHYVETMKHYVELVNGRGSKTQQVCIYLFLYYAALCLFLLLHKKSNPQ